MEPARIDPGPAVTRGREVTIRLGTRSVVCFEGETVGAALHASGERVLMRSIKFHRPRGLFCSTGKCAGCLMRIDGVPNVRACVTPVRDGLRVEHQNAFPTARRDLFAIVDKVYRRKFDVHERFTRPRVLVPLFNAVVRQMAGFGRIPDLRPVVRPSIRRVEVDVLVVGGGPAGLAAAAAAAEGAASVLHVEESDRFGGSLLFEPGGLALVDELAGRARDAGAVSHAHATALGVYMTDGTGDALAPPGVIAILTPEGIIEARPRALVVASGYHETPALVPGNDLPGVMGTRAALILLHRHGIRAGSRIAFAGTGPLTARARLDLSRAGCTIIDGGVTEAWGGTRLEGAIVNDRKEAVDTILCAGDEAPRIELLQQASAKLTLRGNALVPVLLDDHTTSVRGVFAAGSVTDPALSVAERIARGAHAGEAAARHARGGGA